MAFRTENFQASCGACPELTETLCKYCQTPCCTEHQTSVHETKLCWNCHALLIERLAAKGLSIDHLVFKAVPESNASFEAQEAWNAHTDQVYAARFVVAGIVNSVRKPPKQ